MRKRHFSLTLHILLQGLTMQELLRNVATKSGGSSGSGWADMVQPLANFESKISDRITSQALEAREGDSLLSLTRQICIILRGAHGKWGGRGDVERLVFQASHFLLVWNAYRATSLCRNKRVSRMQGSRTGLAGV